MTQKEGEWWTGSIDSRTGIFPSNYVRPKDQEVSLNSDSYIEYRLKIKISTCFSVHMLKVDVNSAGFIAH